MGERATSCRRSLQRRDGGSLDRPVAAGAPARTRRADAEGIEVARAPRRAQVGGFGRPGPEGGGVHQGVEHALLGFGGRRSTSCRYASSRRPPAGRRRRAPRTPRRSPGRARTARTRALRAAERRAGHGHEGAGARPPFRCADEAPPAPLGPCSRTEVSPRAARGAPRAVAGRGAGAEGAAGRW
jgi:hypothetical protein